MDSFKPLFLKLGSDEFQGSAKGCRGFQETKMPNVGEVLLAALNLHVRTKLRVTTFDTNHPVADITQTASRFYSLEAT